VGAPITLTELSTQLESLEAEAARSIETAVKYVTANKLKSLAAGKMGYSTSQVGDLVAQHLADQ